ncbi:exodeoxyribonuclease VII large subunit [Flavobacterium silvaticum]|uniref:Exodeoxyribonuclease 7 large subunit n=1 Tax=Flavobacterium silvaticum TaxID=1852020 RepID=A0A972FSP6_9FLAO|nr:exodeoxyribonuclease VII large subunit [Flavobacterium silvaticum]NMH27292.1 exodeoxyribonuclease VII large subunit [Flavobacterium silvaticum]
MAEISNDRKIFSLLDVTRSVQKTLNERYQTAFWVKAEMNKLNHYSHSGHSYPELVEKSNGQVIAQIKSILWRADYVNINNNFLRTLREPLKDGIKILFLAKIIFDPVHGLSLHILDIDPNYTLGDLELEKQQSIARLKDEGIFDSNKKLSLPILPQRVAIISVETSKGYADFLKVLEENPWHYKFFHMLFPSLLQGEKAVPGIIGQLNQIKKVTSHFDVVAIIRGGGGDVGLSVYNNFELAKAIATFPIPIITGIGHATNETVSEMVSYQNAITPTKIAEFLIQKFHNFSVPVERASEFIIERSRRLLSDEKNNLQQKVKLFRSVTENIVVRNQNAIENSKNTISTQAAFIFRNEKNQVASCKDRIFSSANLNLNQSKSALNQTKERLNLQALLKVKRDELEIENLQRNVSNLDPVNVLKRGFSITRINGKAVTDVSNLKTGQILKTQTYNGTISSSVTQIEMTDGKE